MMLNGKTVVIAGATGGIGDPISRILHERGANLVLFARTEEKLRALENSLGGSRTRIVVGDACDADKVTEALETARSAFGSIHSVVITVGTWGRLSLKETVNEAEESFDHLYKAILKPTEVMGFGAIKALDEQKAGGTLFHLSSHAAVRAALPGNLSYGPLKKAAEDFFTRAIEELGSRHVRIVHIRPAIVNTPDLQKMLAGDPDKEKKLQMAVQPETIGKWIADHLSDLELLESIPFNSELVLD